MNRLSTALYTTFKPVVSGKEWLGADGRDEYDFHARRQYPHLAMFTTPDPLAEATYWISPYAYCGGNPIKYSDPSGMFFSEGTEKYIKRFEKDCASRLEIELMNIITSLINRDGINETIKYVNKVNEYAAAINEIEELRASDTEYFVEIGFKYCKGYETLSAGTTYSVRKSRIEITVPSLTNFGLLAHELKHAYQFEKGLLDFGLANDKSQLYDQTDEVGAYKRQSLFDDSKWEENAGDYSHLSAKPNNEIKSGMTREDLQNKSNEYNIIFKIDGKVFIPNPK